MPVLIMLSFLENKFQNGAHLKKKKTILISFLHLIVTGVHTHTKKNFIYIYIYLPGTNSAHPFDLFCDFLLSIVQKLRITSIWYLFGVDSYSQHFGTINELLTGEPNLPWNVNYYHLLLIQNM